MASKCHNNAIITGYLDSFCLACGVFLRSEQEACTHIDRPLHRKNLDLIPYLEKFKGDRIRKVQMGYYCEFCNALFSIASKVNLHITEDSHKHKKGTLLLRLAGSDVVAFDDVTIGARSWHGVIENMCAVCNIEFEDERLHRSSNKHLLNLVQKPVQFGANNAIFRHVDDNAIQCLTCEKVIASNTMTQHFNDSEHLAIYEKCRNVKSDNVSETSGVIENIENATGGINNSYVPNVQKLEDKLIKKESPIKDTRSKIIESITKYQQNMININLETETASCKKCLVNIKFDYNNIECHIANHLSLINGNVDSELLYPSNFDRNLNIVDIKKQVNEDSSKKAILGKLPDTDLNDDTDDTESIPNQNTTKLNHDSTDIESETDDRIPNQPRVDKPSNGSKNDNESTSKETTVDIDVFAKYNKITYNKDHNNAYCRICQKKMLSSLKNMKEHVAGALHRKNAGIASKPKPLVLTQSMRKFVESKYEVTSVLFADADVINEKYYVDSLSYFMITKTDTGLRCQACEVTLCPYDKSGRIHAKFDTHEELASTIPVVMNFESEFIREVRAGVFHCGYCNFVIGDWDEIQMHLLCSEHEEQKKFAMWRLNQLRPQIAEHKRKEDIQRFMWMAMANRFF